MDAPYDLIIIGSGAGGLGAALYAGRYKMRTLVISHEFGGETAKAGDIWNYPGVPSVDGFDLANTMKIQAKDIGVGFVADEVVHIERTDHCFSVQGRNASYQGHGIVFATGAERRRLGLPNEKELTGKGVHYCVTCDGPVYTGKTIAMVGGGDASVKGINLAAEYVEKAYLIVRGEKLTAEPINLEKMQSLGEKIIVLYETEVTGIIGSTVLEKVKLSKPFNNSDELVINGLFVEVGAQPKVELAVSLGVALDERGYILVDNMMRTNIDGIFACGDAVNHFGAFKQDITAAALGAVAATSAYADRNEHTMLCPYHAVPSTFIPAN